MKSTSVLQPRYQARLWEDARDERVETRFLTSAPLGRVNRQLRGEIAELLQRAANDLPVVTRVKNFDFKHAMRYLNPASSTPRLQQHTARDDGTVPRRLTIELCGPYDQNWRDNLEGWIRYLEVQLPDDAAELGAMHRTVPQYAEWSTRTPPDVVWELYVMHEERGIGSGRRELNKVFFALYARLWEEAMNGRHWGLGDLPYGGCATATGWGERQVMADRRRRVL